MVLKAASMKRQLSGTLRRLVSWKQTDVSEARTASIIRPMKPRACSYRFLYFQMILRARPIYHPDDDGSTHL
jgi:hypothetical protein